MHNPTRRIKHFKRPPRPRNALLLDEEDTGADRHHMRLRPAAPSRPDALVRGAVLVALVVVTFVLYLILWELERSSFASVSVPRLSRNRTVTPHSVAPASFKGTTLDATATRTHYPLSTFSGGLDDSDDSGLDDGERVRRLPTISSRTKLTGNTWPPAVTHMPEVLDPAERENHTLEDEPRQGQEDTDAETMNISLFDAFYCHGACRFLLPVRIGEQESKARMHFTQLLVLAQALKRTIVFPRVGKSRMSACAKWPFGAYYDITALDRAYKGGTSAAPSTIDFEQFEIWVNDRPVPPKGIVVTIESVRQNRRGASGQDASFVVNTAAVDQKVWSCLESRLSRLRASLPETALTIASFSGSSKFASDALSRLVRLLSEPWDIDMNDDDISDFDFRTSPGYEVTPQYTNASTMPLADMDLLVIDYDLRHPLFTPTSVPPNWHLHYSPAFYDLADRLAEHVGPFFGVHWRMETVPVQNLAWCAAALVSTLRALLQHDIIGKNIRYVWLATDHPRPLSTFMNVDRIGEGSTSLPLQETGNGGPQRKSSTFTLSLEHDDAIAMLVAAFQHGGDLDAWTLTDLAEQLRRYPYVEGRLDVNETLLRDPGVFGILDKLVIVQASAFVSGSADCSKTSSFSKQVVEARQESFEAERGKGAIRNVVEYFGKW